MTEKNMCKVTIGKETREFPKGTAYGDVLKEFETQGQSQVMLAVVDGQIRELHRLLKDDCTMEVLTSNDKIGHRTYQRSASFLLIKAIYHVGGQKNIEKVVLHHSMGAGFYYTIRGKVQINQKFLVDVKTYMREQVTKKVPIMKKSVRVDEARRIFRGHGMIDKEKLLRYRQVSSVNIYSMGNFEDYFYGYMAWHTGYLKYFELYAYDDGLILQMPTAASPEEVPPFTPSPKVFQVQKKTEKYGEMLGVDTVGAMNDLICRGEMQKLLLISEALQEGEISKIAEAVVAHPGVKFVMIAGPSSSGKTTFSHRLSIQLEAHGLKPHPIGIDNYYINRENIPLDEHGERDYENLDAIDVKQFNEDMLALLKGERVEMPTMNFVEGRREYRGNYLQLGKDDVLVIEGIHGLNDKLSYNLPKENKFKIYISALTQLNIDEHNRVATTDVRLIRRMVRDNRTRGSSAKDTIAMWNSVRRGEEKNIFPFQEDADVMFNSTLLYELAVLKLYGEPLLYQIEQGEPEYYEAKRLLKMLDYFIGVPGEDIPHNSIVREFVGGGCFEI